MADLSKIFSFLFSFFYFSIFFFNGLLKNPAFHRANISSARIKSPAKILRRITHKGTVPGGCSLEILIMVSSFWWSFLKISDEFSLLSNAFTTRVKLWILAFMMVGFHTLNETFTWYTSDGTRAQLIEAQLYVSQSIIVSLVGSFIFDSTNGFPVPIFKGSTG